MGEPLPEAVGVPVAGAESVAEGLAPRDRGGVGEGEALGGAQGAAVRGCVGEGEGVGVALLEGIPEAVSVPEPLSEGGGAPEGEGEAPGTGWAWALRKTWAQWWARARA